MTKLYQEPVQVKTNSEEIPTEFIWRNRHFQVTYCSIVNVRPSLLKPWIVPGTWYRCETKQGVACDLVKDNYLGWVLERVWD